MNDKSVRLWERHDVVYFNALFKTYERRFSRCQCSLWNRVKMLYFKYRRSSEICWLLIQVSSKFL
jgi:hypothetical protein